MSGVTTPFDTHQLAAAIRRIGAGFPDATHIAVAGDVEAILGAATLGAPGAVIYSGAGSAVYAKGAQSLSLRIGGWGMLRCGDITSLKPKDRTTATRRQSSR
jgi:N-acetylglucosamine kinase-like BadF-type ATPase